MDRRPTPNLSPGKSIASIFTLLILFLFGMILYWMYLEGIYDDSPNKAYNGPKNP